MRVKNVFRINDWKMTEFLVVIFSLQFGLLCLELLGGLGYDIPLLRQAIGFLYLTFVPGALLLRILKVHQTSGVESVLYMAGLSLAFDILAGFLINTLYPVAGIDNPITSYYVTISMFIGVVLLSVLCYSRDRDYSDPGADLDIDDNTLAPLLFLALIPLVGILSAYAANVYNTKILIYVVLLAIAAIVVLCGFGRFIPPRLYPLAVFVVAAALQFHNAFISNYLWSWDVHIEYDTASQVIATGHWDQSIALTVNAMLSIVILAPFYNLLGGIELTWVFKIAYQLLFCLVPLGLYSIYRKQTDDRIACLACMFFMFLVTFFTEMQGLARQETAELFLVLIVMLLVDARGSRLARSVLIVVFVMGLIVSHYGLAYIYLIVFALSLVIISLSGRWTTSRWNARDRSDAPRNSGGPRSSGGTRRPQVNHTLTFAFVGLFVCAMLLWYIYTSNAVTLSSVSYLLYKMVTNVFTEFLNPEHVQGLNMILKGYSSPLYELKKYMQLMFQGFIVVGFSLVVASSFAVIDRKAYRFSLEYLALSFANLLICIFSITLPYFASSLNTSRVYQITLVVLSPVCIIGALELIKAIASLLKRLKVGVGPELPARVTALVLVVYLFFNTGLVFDVLNDRPMSVALARSEINGYSLYDRAVLYDPLNTFEQDYYATTWLDGYRLEDSVVYSDYISLHPLLSYGNMPIADTARLRRNTTGLPEGSYVYLGYANLKGDVFKEASGTRLFYETGEVLPVLERYDEIYDSEGSAIYGRV